LSCNNNETQVDHKERSYLKLFKKKFIYETLTLPQVDLRIISKRTLILIFCLYFMHFLQLWIWTKVKKNNLKDFGSHLRYNLFEDTIRKYGLLNFFPTFFRVVRYENRYKVSKIDSDDNWIISTCCWITITLFNDWFCFYN
jgi:hypothetical protein